MKEGRPKVIGNAPQPALRIIARFRHRFPDIRVDFGLYDWTTATSMIRDRLADVGLITDAPKHDMWERILIETSQYVLYCRQEHPFAQRSEVSLKDLEGETLILPEKGSLTRRILEQAFRQHDIELKRSISMTTFPLMCEAVLQGIGVAIFLRNSSLIQDNIAEVAVREMSAEQKTYLIATKDRIRLKLVAEFVGSAVE